MPKRSTELKLPTQLLDRISGEGFDDAQWRQAHNLGGKRKSRKQSRKEERQVKKQKRGPPPTSKNGNRSQGNVKPQQGAAKPEEEPKPVKAKPKPPKPTNPPKNNAKSDKVLRPFLSAHEEELRRKDEEDAQYYAKKLGLKSLSLKDEGDGLGDILGDLDFDHISDESEDADENEDISENDGSGSEDGFDDDGWSDDESADDGEMTASETMAKLKALKEKKNKASKDAELRVVKESDLSDLNDSEGESEQIGGDDESDDNIGMDGLGDDDDSLSEGDFEGDSDGSEGEPMSAEETMAKLAALKKKKQANAKEGAPDADGPEEDGSDSFDLSSESEDESGDDNPYVPPTRRGRSDEDVPSEPAKRQNDSESAQTMRRAFKGALNKLTEPTLSSIINSIELVFMKNSQAEASEILTEQLLDLISSPQPLQHTLFTVYSGLVAALYQLVGIGFAAHFVQEVVERLVAYPDNASNLLTLLVECYSLRVISSKLLYDLMKKLLQDVETPESLVPVELLLTIIRNGGSQLRSDDPAALKEVILILQQRMQKLGGVGTLPPRMRFLVDAVVALKNNRQRPLSELVIASRHRIRKFLQSTNGSKGSASSVKEPLQVSLSDILDSKSRGKWWLVGASWKGAQRSEDQDEDNLDIDLDDEFGASSHDWLELAKKQRLNTDVRRAVFVALMGAEDYLDACLRIDKLGLKNKQERDVPHVILHCLNRESYYNPYYALVASKQCTRHSTMKTFQFRLWDWLNSEPRGDPQAAMHYGRFYAALVGERVMPLDVLKAADFLAGTQDVKVFLEVFCVTLYKILAKQAEKLAKQTAHRGLVRIPGQDDVDRDGKELVVMLTKVREPAVLRGLQLVNKTVLKSEIIQSPKDHSRVAWAAELVTDLADELARKTE